MRRYARLLGMLVFLGGVAGARTEEEKKASYLKKAETELTELNSKVDSLQKRSGKAGAETRTEIDRQVQVLREKLEKVRQKLTELKNTGESGWTSFRRGMDEAMSDLRRAYRKTVSFFKKSEDGKP